MTQEWFPTVAFPALIEALTVWGVAPEDGERLSHAQSDPSDDVNPTPLDGLVLLSDIVRAAGTVPPAT